MINNVPMEVLIHIFARLDPSSLIFTAQVCKFWRHIVKDDACCRLPRDDSRSNSPHELTRSIMQGDKGL
jgi:hypothetical protein